MLPDNSNLNPLRKILIIDDDPFVAEIYKRQFELAGFEVDTALNGQEGFYRIFKTHPDAILLDLMLPGMNGIEIIKKFRVQRQYATLPIIVLSNAYMTEMGSEAVRVGATSVFNKATVVPQDIIAAVESALALSAHVQGMPASAQAEEKPLSIEGDFWNPSQAPAAPMPEPPVHAPVAESVPAPEKPAEPVQAERHSPMVMDEPSASADVSPQEPDFLTRGVDQEIAFRAVLLQDFVRKSAERVDHMREVLRNLQAAEGRMAQVESLIDLARVAHGISASASIVGLRYLAHLTAAIEALIWELFDNPAQLGSSTLRSIAKAIDTVARLVDFGANHKLKELSQFSVLVVDDEPIARRVISHALDRAKLAYVAIGRPEVALELLDENPFDLIIMDIKMEGLNGFELCAQIRKIKKHSTTPVIFVSSLNDFHSKVVSTTSGGNDFVVKPFVPMELALKAFLHMITAHLDSTPAEPTPANSEKPTSASSSSDSGLTSTAPSKVDRRAWNAEFRGL
ncbi:MAG: response regulator [Verrucomicrobiota bacterium]